MRGVVSRVRGCQRGCAHAAPVCMYDREVEKGRKSRNVIQSPKRRRESTAERKSETTGISRGIVFLVTHPVFVPALLQCVGGGNKILHVHRETWSTAGMLTNNNNKRKRLQYSLNTTRPVVTTSRHEYCAKMCFLPSHMPQSVIHTAHHCPLCKLLINIKILFMILLLAAGCFKMLGTSNKSSK